MKNHHDHCDHDHNISAESSHGLHGPRPQTKAFQISILFNFLFVLIEFYYGFVSNSLSLIGDAGHNLGDVFALALAWLGYNLVQSASTERLNFGFKKFSIIAAFLNSFLLILMSFYILFEAYERLQRPHDQNAPVMILVSGVGLIINFSTALLFKHGHQHDLNLKSAYLHLLGDALVSLGVVIAGVLIYWKNWSFVDPITSVVIAIIIFIGTWGLFKESIVLMMNGVPSQINYQGLMKYLKETPGVIEVIELKVWASSTAEFNMNVKLKTNDRQFDFKKIEKAIQQDFRIQNTFFQIEYVES
jgi:cobalt-zinc-cadmium efflux system protein